MNRDKQLCYRDSLSNIKYNNINRFHKKFQYSILLLLPKILSILVKNYINYINTIFIKMCIISNDCDFDNV